MLERIEARLSRMSAARAALSRAAVVREAVVREAEAVPGVSAAVEDGGVALTGRGLRARAFGTRARPADPRVAGIADAARRAR